MQFFFFLHQFTLRNPQRTLDVKTSLECITDLEMKDFTL